MNWLIARQYRSELLYGGPIFAALLLLLLIGDMNLRSALHDAGVNACLAQTPITPDCDSAVSRVIADHDWFGSIMPWLNFLPVIIGLVAAAPLILEFDQRTYRLAWTQSVGRTRWFLQKIAFALVASLLAAIAVTLVYSHLYEPIDRMQGHWGNSFNFEGTVFVSYTLFAVALAVACGVLTKRAFPSFVITVIVFLVARVGIGSFIRPHFLTPITKVMQPNNIDRRDWILSEGMRLRGDGTPLPMLCAPKVPGCEPAAEVFTRLVYHPANRFWTFQAIETSIFVTAAIALLAVSYWWVRSRTA